MNVKILLHCELHDSFGYHSTTFNFNKSLLLSWKDLSISTVRGKTIKKIELWAKQKYCLLFLQVGSQVHRVTRDSHIKLVAHIFFIQRSKKVMLKQRTVKGLSRKFSIQKPAPRTFFKASSDPTEGSLCTYQKRIGRQSVTTRGSAHRQRSQKWFLDQLRGLEQQTGRDEEPRCCSAPASSERTARTSDWHNGRCCPRKWDPRSWRSWPRRCVLWPRECSCRLSPGPQLEVVPHRHSGFRQRTRKWTDPCAHTY